MMKLTNKEKALLKPILNDIEGFIRNIDFDKNRDEIAAFEKIMPDVALHGLKEELLRQEMPNVNVTEEQRLQLQAVKVNMKHLIEVHTKW